MADRIGTLVADTVTSVDVNSERIEVLNRDGSAEIFVRIGSTAPTVGDTDPKTFCIPAVAGAARSFYRNIAGSDKTQTVKLISAGTPTYSVQPL
jgi:hypothetical protein